MKKLNKKIRSKEEALELKNMLIFQQMVYPTYPISNNPAVREFLDEFMGLQKGEGYFERCLAKASKGLYRFVNGDGYDFSDGTEAKCISCYIMNDGKMQFELSGMGRFGEYGQGEFKGKTGAIRVAIVNLITETIDYFFLPKAFWETCTITKATNNTGNIRGTYSKKHYDTYTMSRNNLEIFRCTFNELALLPADTSVEYFIAKAEAELAEAA